LTDSFNFVRGRDLPWIGKFRQEPRLLRAATGLMFRREKPISQFNCSRSLPAK